MNPQQTTKTDNKPDIKKYVPYGMNGEYFVYDNEASQIPMGYGSKGGTKAKIKKLCADLNRPVKDEK